LKDTILKSLQPFTIPTGIQLAIMRLIGVTASVAYPALQGIVVTRDMALAFWIYSILCGSAWSGSCASLKGILSRYHFEIREYN
jgi:hypothetical protein